MRVCAALLVAALAVAAARGDDKAEDKAPAKLTAQELAGRIDQHIDAKIKVRKVTVAPAADDAELVRRLHLDLSGRIPDLMTARDYIDSPEKDKFAQQVDALLKGDRYAVHWANVWRAWLLADPGDQQVLYLAPQFEGWLRQQLKTNTAYDRMVRSLVQSANGRMAFGGTGPAVFTQANQYKAENMASSVARLFLGVKVECAQCHDHPFAKWKRKQFWETAAFFADLPDPFAQVDPKGGRRPARKAGEIKMPGNDKVIKARLLDGTEPVVKNDDYRTALVDWMVAKDNPYFARAAVNRVWEQLMGVGLVEPLDEESAENRPSHPELLTVLAQQFAENGYDLKYLIRAIVSSRAYQRTSKQTHASQADPRLFARMKVRGLSPEQMFDSLSVATGQREDDDVPADPRLGLQPNLNSARADFVRRFPAPEKRTEQATSILQALYLMNGSIVADATSLEKNKNLAIIAEGKSVPTGRRVDQLFLITLNRKPTAAERLRFVKYVDRGGPKKDAGRALCDVFWALLNSSEFCVNH